MASKGGSWKSSGFAPAAGSKSGGSGGSGGDDKKLDQLGYTGIKKENLAASLKGLGNSKADQMVRNVLLQPKGSDDERRGWQERIMSLHDLSQQKRLSKADLESATQLGNEQGMFRHATPAGKASRYFLEQIYKKTSPSGRKLMAEQLGASSTSNGTVETAFVKRLNRQQVREEKRALAAQERATVRRKALRANRPVSSQTDSLDDFLNSL